MEVANWVESCLCGNGNMFLLVIDVILGCMDIPGAVDKYGYQCGHYKESWCKYVKLWDSSAERKCCICGGGKRGISSQL